MGGGSDQYNTAFGTSALSSNITGGTQNVAIGWNSLLNNTTGTNNSAVGMQTLKTNTTGTDNSAFGLRALQGNTTGSFNTGIGDQSLYNNTTASSNTAVGYQAAYSNTTGVVTAVGRQALYSNTTGICNTAVGGTYSANPPLYANTTGNYNSAFGEGALAANTTASNNTAVGYQAGYSNVTGALNTYLGKVAGYNATGNGNTLLGEEAGYNLTTGNRNTFVGAAYAGTGASGYYITTGSSNTILGAYNGNQGGLDIRTSSNYIVLSDGDGNPRGGWDNNGYFYPTGASGSWNTPSSTVNGFVIQAQYGALSSVPSGNVNMVWYKVASAGQPDYQRFVVGGSQYGAISWNGTTGTLYTTTSDQRVKENIVDANSALEKINSIKVRSFNFKSDNSHVDFGVIAQELYEVAPECVAKGDNKEEIEQTWGVDTSVLVPAMLKAIQELTAEVNSLKQKVGA